MCLASVNSLEVRKVHPLLHLPPLHFKKRVLKTPFWKPVLCVILPVRDHYLFLRTSSDDLLFTRPLSQHWQLSTGPAAMLLTLFASVVLILTIKEEMLTQKTLYSLEQHHWVKPLKGIFLTHCNLGNLLVMRLAETMAELWNGTRKKKTFCFGFTKSALSPLININTTNDDTTMN